MELIKTKKGSAFLSDRDRGKGTRDVVALYLQLPYTTPVQNIIDIGRSTYIYFFRQNKPKLTNATDKKIQ